MAGKPNLDRWFNRAGLAATLWGLLPPTAVAALMAYLSTGVAWIREMGAFGWLMAGLTGFVMTALGMALLTKNRLWKLDAKHRERLMSESSPFDPMERVFRDKRLFLRDLAPAGRREVKGRKFINCEIIGPGSMAIDLRSDDTKPWPTVKESLTFDVDVIQTDPGKVSNHAVYFPDCDFDGCSFYHLSLLFFNRGNETLHWITPDFNQPMLPTTPIPSFPPLEDKSK